MDRITEVLKTIDETSNEVELIISEENNLVANLGKEFNSIVENADHLYHISQNNLNELIKIEKPIEEQKLASQEISKKIVDIENLSKRVAM
jgi:methyl-accepting chemotaxis protein